MKQTLRPNAELDLLTKEELRDVLTEIVSGHNRPPERIRHPGGVTLDGSGNAPLTGIYRVEAGMRAIVTRIEFFLDGYSMRSPFNPTPAGGIDIYVDAQWRDGFPFGGSTGFILPAVYTEARERAIVAEDGAHMQIQVGGGPASTGLTVALCGILVPIEPVL